MDIGYVVTVLGVILISMMLHELAHGFIALKLGDDTARLLGRLSFNPLRHVDPFMTIMLPLLIVITNAMVPGSHLPVFGGAKPVPINPANIRSEWGAALIAISGPLVNLVIAFVCYAVYVWLNVPQHGVASMILSTATWVNLGFFAFNIVPIPPLDGSRVLYALAPDVVRHVMDAIERYGTLLVLVVVLLFQGALMAYMSGMITVILTLFGRILGVGD